MRETTAKPGYLSFTPCGRYCPSVIVRYSLLIDFASASVCQRHVSGHVHVNGRRQENTLFALYNASKNHGLKTRGLGCEFPYFL